MTSKTDPLEMLAAVSGTFDPLALAPAGDPGALGPLSLKCEESIEDGKLRWMLKGDYRRAALAKLDSPTEARSLIRQAPPPASDDLFTQTLRKALLGKSEASWTLAQHNAVTQNPGRLSQAQQRDFAIQSALQFAGHAGYVELKSPIAATRGRLSQRRGQLALRATLPKRLIGRRSELATLLSFATEYKHADPLPFYLTGIGGVGKSAMVSALMLELQKAGALAVLVDFDAVGMAGGEPIPVFLEFLRQYAQLLRSHGLERDADRSSEARDQIQASLKDRGTGSRGSAVEDQFSRIFSFGLPSLGRVPVEFRRAPLLLVFDSFEVVPPRQLPAVMRLFELLQENVPLHGLRLIVSGRELPPPNALAPNHPAAPDPRRTISLGGLSDGEGARFLAAYDSEGKFKSAALRRRAASALSGHPLALLVLERFARNQPLQEIEEVLSELERDSGFAAEFAQSFLYTRVLDRISDKSIARLAHPGLILREVTPGLIRLVLAGPCKLGEIGDAEATDLLRKLAEHYWLVEPLGADHLRHRADVRRMMIPSMLAGPRPTDPPEVAARKVALRESSIEVARAAAAFWRNGPAKGDSTFALFDARGPEDRWVEATYYGALAGEPPPTKLSAEQAAALDRGIGKDDLATLKPSWRGEIKAALRNFDSLQADEIESLSVPSREQFQTYMIDRSIKSGASKEAAAMATSETLRAREQRRLQEVQILLSEAGYYQVRIDGVLGPAMRRALGDLGIPLPQEEGRAPDWAEKLLRQTRRKLKQVMASAAKGPKSAAVLLASEPAPALDPTIPRGDELTVELAESQATADFDNGECNRDAVELLIQHLITDRLPSALRGEIEKGRLWNTGLWKGALTAAARKLIPGSHFDWSNGGGSNPNLQAATLLVAGLFDPTVVQKPENLERLAWIVSRSDGWLEGHDGLRLLLRIARWLRFQPNFRFSERIAFDGSVLTLLARDGLIDYAVSSGWNRRWIAQGDEAQEAAGASALSVEGNGLERYRMLLTGPGAALAEFEAAWRASLVLRAEPAQLALGRLDDLRTLRPQAPELVLPAARLLNQLGPEQAAAVANRIAQLALTWPRDLWFKGQNLPSERSKAAQNFNPEWSFTVAETADRCGLLGPLLEALSSPEARRLHQIHSHLIANFALEGS